MRTKATPTPPRVSSSPQSSTCVTLLRPLERALRGGHPWIYREAIEPVAGTPGTIVTVLNRRGRFVARGYVDRGPIAVRVLTTRDEPIDASLIARRLERASVLRDRTIPPDTDAYRLLHGEGDRLPGIVVDVYGPHAVMRLDGAGVRGLLPLLEPELEQVLRRRGVEGLLEREGARGEPRTTRVVFGTLPDDPVAVHERGMVLVADLVAGHKTGLFLDQREARHRVRQVARGLRVLDLYGYTGGFSVAAGLGGAVAVTTVDVSSEALDLARRTWLANGLRPDTLRTVAADVASFLDADEPTSYDLVVADPPSFAPSEAAVPGALHAYRTLHGGVLRRLTPGGLYLAASCSSHVDRAAFDETLAAAARAERRVLQVLDRWAAPPDHPRLVAFPEGDYLKITLARVVD